MMLMTAVVKVAPRRVWLATRLATHLEGCAFFLLVSRNYGLAALQCMRFVLLIAAQDFRIEEAMNDEEILIPIASRHLVFVDANGRKTELYVAISAPYFPARLEGMEQMAACQVLTCDDPTLTTELFGADEMEALVAGLEFLELFLVNLVKENGGGRLTLRDGSPFDPAGSILLRESRRLAVKNVRQG